MYWTDNSPRVFVCIYTYIRMKRTHIVDRRCEQTSIHTSFAFASVHTQKKNKKQKCGWVIGERKKNTLRWARQNECMVRICCVLWLHAVSATVSIHLSFYRLCFDIAFEWFFFIQSFSTRIKVYYLCMECENYATDLGGKSLHSFNVTHLHSIISVN